MSNLGGDVVNHFDALYTPQPIPEPSPYRKSKRGGPRQHPPLLTPLAIEDIRKKFSKDRVSMKTLAIKYGCHYRTISKIIHFVSPYQK